MRESVKSRRKGEKLSVRIIHGIIYNQSWFYNYDIHVSYNYVAEDLNHCCHKKIFLF